MVFTETRSPIVNINGPLNALETDLLVIPWFEEDAPSAVAGVDAATGGEISRALTSREFVAKPFDLFLAPVVDRGWRSRRVALLGAGKEADFCADMVRKVAGAAGLMMRQRRIERVGFLLRGRGERS